MAEGGEECGGKFQMGLSVFAAGRELLELVGAGAWEFALSPISNDEDRGSKIRLQRAGEDMKTHRIAVIPGDGIGKETVPEGVRVLDAAARRFEIGLEWEWFDFASCDYYAKHGKMLPDDWFAVLRKFDAIYFGAVGWPETVPDHVSLWGSLLQFRRGFDQYLNLRPVRLMPGIRCPKMERRRI